MVIPKYILDQELMYQQADGSWIIGKVFRICINKTVRSDWVEYQLVYDNKSISVFTSLLNEALLKVTP